MYQSQSINPSQMKMENSLNNSQANNFLSSNIYNQFHSPMKENIYDSNQNTSRSLINNDNKTEINLNIM